MLVLTHLKRTLMIFVHAVTLVSHGADETPSAGFQFTTPISRMIIREMDAPR
jgi:hypothetical protein